MVYSAPLLNICFHPISHSPTIFTFQIPYLHLTLSLQTSDVTWLLVLNLEGQWRAGKRADWGGVLIRNWPLAGDRALTIYLM